MTKQQREAVAAVKAWCKKNKLKLLSPPRHVHPRAYVVGHAAPMCLIVAECWADSESQLRQWNRKHPLRTVNEFDSSLKAGDWCITAYITTAGHSQPIAIPLKEQP